MEKAYLYALVALSVLFVIATRPPFTLHGKEISDSSIISDESASNLAYSADTTSGTFVDNSQSSISDLAFTSQTQPPQQQQFRQCNVPVLIAQPQAPPQGQALEITRGWDTSIAFPGVLWPGGQPYIATYLGYYHIITPPWTIVTSFDDWKAYGYRDGIRPIRLLRRPPDVYQASSSQISAYANRVAYIARTTSSQLNYLLIKETGPGFFGEGNEIDHLVFASPGFGGLLLHSGRTPTIIRDTQLDLVANGIIYRVYDPNSGDGYYVRQGFGPNNIPEQVGIGDDTIEVVNPTFPVRSSIYDAYRVGTSNTKVSTYMEFITNGGFFRVRLTAPGPDGTLGTTDDESYTYGVAGDQYDFPSLADDASFFATVRFPPSGGPRAYYADLRNFPPGSLPTQPTLAQIPLSGTPTGLMAVAIDGAWSTQPIGGSIAIAYDDVGGGVILEYRDTGPNGFFGDSDDKVRSVRIQTLIGMGYALADSISIKENIVAFGEIAGNILRGIYRVDFC